MVGNGERVRVRCKECSFEKVVETTDDVKPADVLIEHGQRTSHTLTIDRIDEEDG